MNAARIALIAGTSAALACAPPSTPDRSLPEGVADGSPEALVESSLLPAVTIRGEPVVRSSLADRMAELGVPGVSVAVLVDGEIAWARGYGLADVESGRPVTPNTLFQAASISKPVAALAALRLVESGRVDLDGDVNAYLTSWQVPGNEFTEQAPVTLRGLLTHRAGLTVWGFPGYGPGEEVPAATGVLDGHGNTDPVRAYKAPGGELALLRRRVHRDAATRGGHPRQAVRRGHARGSPRPDRHVALDVRAAHSTRAPGRHRDGLPGGRRPRSRRVAHLSRTGGRRAVDDAERTRALRPEMQRAWKGESTRVLGEALAREMLTPDADDWGLGPAISEDGERFRHGGSNQGFRCTFAAYIDGDDGVFVMTNSDSGSELAAEVAITVAHAYGWSGPRAEERAPGEEGTGEGTGEGTERE